MSTCQVCDKREAIKTDGEGRDVCHHCAAGLPEPYRHPGEKIRRNEPCPCGSGKKFNRCHLAAESVPALES